MKSEAAITVGTVTAAVTAVIALLVAYGVDMTQDQQTAIMGLVAVLAPFFVGILTRPHVFSQETVENMVPVGGELKSVDHTVTP